MSYQEIKATRTYLGGFTTDDQSVRKYKYVLESDIKKYDKLVIISETVTPRLSPESHDIGKTIFFIEGKEEAYNTKEELLNSI
jgi:hypothetical protein